MRLLITGATGFVGRNLVIAAAAGGRYERITCVVRDVAKLERQLREDGVDPAQIHALPWHELDRAAMQTEHAVHCAGVLFARDRETYFHVNVDESLRVLSALPASCRLVALSSQSAGGPTPLGTQARSVGMPDAPLTWYGESKLAMESALRSSRPDALILRPPMILGPRDAATLPLFRMARGIVRPKPGLSPKWFSWIAADDLCRDVLEVLGRSDWSDLPQRLLYAAAPQEISDCDLVETAAMLQRTRGFDLPLPHPVLRVAARVVDAIPTLREATPSLTRDRVREIFEDRWVVDASAYRDLLDNPPYATLRNTLRDTLDWYRTSGKL